MQRATLDLWVGLFVIGGLVALVILGLKVGNLGTFTTPETYTVYAEFDNIGGLKARAPVKSAGVVVGRVGGITFDPESYRARVQLDIEQRYPFSKDTAAAVLTSGLLGEQYIGLEGGADTAMLQGGDRILLTQSAVVLEKLIGQLIYGRTGGAAEPEPAALPTPPGIGAKPKRETAPVPQSAPEGISAPQTDGAASNAPAAAAAK